MMRQIPHFTSVAALLLRSLYSTQLDAALPSWLPTASLLWPDSSSG